MKWLLQLVCVNGLTAAALYPLITVGAGRPFSWLQEVGYLLAGAGALYLLFRFRRSW